MYLHLGQSVVVPYRDIIGLFDLDNASSSHLTRKFLERAEKEGRVEEGRTDRLPLPDGHRHPAPPGGKQQL